MKLATKEERQSHVMRKRAACAYLGITERTMDKWIQAGKLPKGIKLSERHTVWKRAELDAFIESCREAG